jgi:hypothetical protein
VEYFLEPDLSDSNEKAKCVLISVGIFFAIIGVATLIGYLYKRKRKDDT